MFCFFKFASFEPIPHPFHFSKPLLRKLIYIENQNFLKIYQ